MSKRPKVLRGAALKERISEVISEMALEARESGKPFQLHQTVLAKRVPTSRQSIVNHSKWIDRLINELGGTKKARDGKVTISDLNARIVRLQTELHAKDQQLAALREFHVELFSRIRMTSSKVAFLAEECGTTISSRTGSCPICGGSMGSMDTEDSNLVEFKK